MDWCYRDCADQCINARILDGCCDDNDKDKHHHKCECECKCKCKCRCECEHKQPHGHKECSESVEAEE